MVNAELMRYGPDSTKVNHKLGSYTGHILKGEKPADLPLMLPNKFEL
jgi:putative ABC transport system substrate-binding protein